MYGVKRDRDGRIEMQIYGVPEQQIGMSCCKRLMVMKKRKREREEGEKRGEEGGAMANCCYRGPPALSKLSTTWSVAVALPPHYDRRTRH